MKMKLILAWLAIIAVAALASTVTHLTICGRNTIAQDHLGDAKFLAQALGLSPAQAQELGQQQAAVDAKLADCCARHCAARAGLGKVLAGGTNGLAQAQALIKEMSRAYEESERLTWEHIQQVRSVLTLAQQARYDALVTRCVGGTCNMDVGSK